MKRILFSILAICVSLNLTYAQADQKLLTRYVDPFIGTDYVGHTYPAACLPFGMVQVGPDNFPKWTWDYCAGYNFDSDFIRGFSHTHLSGTGCADMGDVLFMPVTGDVPFVHESAEKSYGSHYSHQTEAAWPGYYGVYLSDYNIKVDLAATRRGAYHSYIYPRHEQSGILIDLEHGINDEVIESSIKMVDTQTIVGFRRSKGFVEDHQYYFYAYFSKPFENVSTYVDGQTGKNTDVKGKAVKMLIRFATEVSEKVDVKVGLSTISIEGAQRNLEKEIPSWGIHKVIREAEKTWHSYLSRIEMEELTEGQKVSFYTSLYHSLIMPNLVTDIDGQYVGWDHKPHRSTDGELYTNFSLWDTYRAQHPFLNLMYPEMNSAMIRSMLEKYRQTGLLVTNEYGLCETWCMIGNHAVNPIVDAYLKGDRSFDDELAYEAVKKSMTADHNKADWTKYNQYGYFPYDDSYIESVSRTMESCYDDYCVAMMAKAMGKTADYKFFLKRAENYRNLFDKNTGFIRARDTKGNWYEPFNPAALITPTPNKRRDYTEGNAWQWTWHVQHNPEGLIKLFGNKQQFVTKLDSLFKQDPSKIPGAEEIPDVTGLIGLYSHGNEPSHHVAYLYPYADRRDRTAEIVRQVFDEFYLASRDGLCGNDDCGQMSAWYMFSGMGFYPVDPVSGDYVFGAPQFKYVKLSLPNGNSLEIKANNLSKENLYVKAIRLNGKALKGRTISYKEVMQGGILEYDMTSEPIKK